MNILFWNCKGFDTKVKVEALRDLFKSRKPSIILLLEAKMEETKSTHVGKKIFMICDSIAIGCIGASEGVMTLLHLKVTFCSNNCILTIFRFKENDLRFSIINLYMPVGYMDKIRC
jgi:exonuclease III